MELSVLYVDNHLLALNKPGAILTQPSGTDRDNLEDRAKAWVKREYNKPGAVFLEAAHRIDSSASGVVLFGRTSKSVSRLAAAVRERRVTKTYLAIVEGRPEETEGTLVHFVAHDDHKARVVKQNGKGASEARLNFKMRGWQNGKSLLEIDLETGRYHQIRVQLAAIGCPIVGDSKYGASSNTYGSIPNRDIIALHHKVLTVPHPVGGEMLTFTAPTPPDWPW